MKEIIDFNNSFDNVNDVKIFFGKYDGIQRYDRFKYPISEKLARAMESATWFPREINFTKDRNGFNSVLSEEFKEIYKANLLFQTLADSLANRFLDNVLSEYITSPEWEAVIKWQAHQELIHSQAYSWNIREVFTDPEVFFNEGFRNKNIQKRLDLERKAYKNMVLAIEKSDSMDFKKSIVLEALIKQYVLESIRFFVSFLYTFKINEINSQVLQGSENNIVLIANDEQVHVTIFKTLINILKDNEEEGFSHLFTEEINEIFKDSFKDVIESELEWFEYLSDIQEIQGFSKQTVTEFLEYFSERSLKGIGIEGTFNGKQNELVSFFLSKTNINNQKALAQETDVLSYNIGVLENGAYDEDDIKIDLNNLDF